MFIEKEQWQRHYSLKLSMYTDILHVWMCDLIMVITKIMRDTAIMVSYRCSNKL